MTLRDWLEETRHSVGEKGLQGLTDAVYKLYLGMWRRADGFIPQKGTNIYEYDWDVLVVLDGCRPDLFEECIDEYDFLESWSVKRSLASDSPTWMNSTFTEEYATQISSTAYISGNAFCAKYLDASKFALMDVVSNYVWDDQLQTIPPRPITDRAISTYREHDPEQMIVHYMQPHIPFIRATSNGYERILDGYNLTGTRRDKHAEHLTGDNEWDLLRKGEIDFKTFWSAYRENLKCVINDVEILLNNINASKVVLTADHGNAIGEYGIYGHPGLVPLSAIRAVPWCETSATDAQTYQPTIEPGDESIDVEERLKHLGYK